MDKTKIQHYGDELYQALLERKPVDPLTDREPSITIEDAYQIQLRMIRRRLDAGETIVGNPRDAAAFPECAEFLRIQHGTKGGRLRDVPLTTDGQRELLARVTAAVAPGMYVGRPGFTSTQNSARFYYVIRKCGIAKKLLGVVAHGLRHQFVNDAYEAETGSPSPVRGGVGRPVGDIEARARAARLLGHSRTRATAGYIGAQGRGPAAPSQGSTDSQAGDAP